MRDEKAVDYTPQAIELIRQGASARDLGWMPAFYDSVCKRFGIEPLKAKPVAPVAPKRLPPNAIDWNKKNSVLTRGPFSIALPARQAAIFDHLYAQHLAGNRLVIAARDMLEGSKCKDATMLRVAVCAFNKSAKPLSIHLKGYAGQYGGFRFIDLLSPTPALGTSHLPKALGNFSWDNDNRELTRHGCVVELSGQSAALFDCLQQRFVSGDHTFILRDNLCAQIGMSATTLPQVIFLCNGRIGKLRLRIEGRLGRPGGYRLADLAEPAVIAEFCSVASESIPTRERD